MKLIACVALALLCGCESNHFDQEIVSKEIHDNKGVPRLEDYLGHWKELVANRVGVYVQKHGDKIQLIEEGKGGYYTGGKSEYDCIYDKKTGTPKYNKIKHENYCATCNNFSYEKDQKEFNKCAEKYPESVDMNGALKTRYDNTPGTIRIVTGEELRSLDGGVEYVQSVYGHETTARGLYVPGSYVFFKEQNTKNALSRE